MRRQTDDLGEKKATVAEKEPAMKNHRPKSRIIDADGHVRETDDEIIEYMSRGYRARRDAMLYFPLTPHHGWHRSIPANDFRHQDFRVPHCRALAGNVDA